MKMINDEPVPSYAKSLHFKYEPKYYKYMYGRERVETTYSIEDEFNHMTITI